MFRPPPGHHLDYQPAYQPFTFPLPARPIYPLPLACSSARSQLARQCHNLSPLFRPQSMAPDGVRRRPDGSMRPSPGLIRLPGALSTSHLHQPPASTIRTAESTQAAAAGLIGSRPTDISRRRSFTGPLQESLSQRAQRYSRLECGIGSGYAGGMRRCSRVCPA